MKSLLVVLAGILFGFSIACGEDLPEKKEGNWWPTCVAQFCFDQQAPRESELIQLHGSGVFKNEGEKSLHCYIAPNLGIFLKFTIHNDKPPFIDSILISDKPVCAKAMRPTKPFKQLSTLEGLMVGDGYEKAIQLYGIPKYVRTGKKLNVLIRDEFSSLSPKMDFDKAIAYGPNETDDLLVTWLFFRKNQLAAMLMSISE